MTTALLTPVQDISVDASIKQQLDGMMDDILTSLPDPKQLSSKERRGIIARYTAVLEGNFIYWMTATYMAVQSEEARPLLLENLHEEVRDSHPVMLRKFAIAAKAFPTDTDALAVNDALNDVRRFLGRLSAVQSLATMAFFESFIQKLMPYLTDLALAEGSMEREYTDVHGICDIAHSQELYRALALEMAVNPLGPGGDLYEGVALLRTLILKILDDRGDRLAA
jgi:hypothetical protein